MRTTLAPTTPHFWYASPRKKAGSLEDGTDFYDAEATRPLALVNTDNRLVAAAAKRRWERALSQFVYKHQRGFLPGRSIIQNVVDVED